MSSSKGAFGSKLLECSGMRTSRVQFENSLFFVQLDGFQTLL